MINHPASLLDVFPELELPENDRASLTQNTVTDMDLHPSRREVSVCIQSSVYLPATLLREIEDQIQKAYLLRDVSVAAHYPAALLPEMAFSDLIELICENYPYASAILAGCRRETENNVIHLYLKANGVDELRPYLARVEQSLSEWFSSPVRLELHSGKELSREELFEQTRQIREQAMEAVPMPDARTPVSEPAPSTKTQPSDLLYGKPFSYPVMPMKDVSLDVFKACIEGVEDVPVYELLRDLCGADSIQGYLFGRPEMPHIFEEKFLEHYQGEPYAEREDR